MSISTAIRALAEKYARELKKRTEARVEEMKIDDRSHHLIYRVLGVSDQEGELIDIYQNKGRFLYNYAGVFLQEASLLCFREKYPDARRVFLENLIGKRPKRFEIDCLIDNEALEIKWRDATTDGDHVTKEHTRLQVVKSHGYKPVRVMFFAPNRSQALKIQETLKTIHVGIGGEYYAGEEAWEYVRERTGIDLKANLIEIIQTFAEGTPE